MSTTDYLLNTAPFPENYAERLIEILGITQSNFVSLKDALYHFRRLDDDQAAEVMRHMMEAATTPTTTEIDVHALLAGRREIAVIWCIEDVQANRPDLTDDQCWEVLEAAKRYHDATIGINWDVLNCHAEMLFGYAPETDEAEEA
jgi:hypothetical protein